MDCKYYIGKKIAVIRKQQGITQEQLSKMTGLSQANICRIENGKYNFSIDTIKKIANALNIEFEIKYKAAN